MYEQKDKYGNSIYLQPIDEYEIVGIISHFQKNKFLGHLDMPVRLIKHAKHFIATNLAQVFNTCLQAGYYPDLLKVTKVVPLLKKGCKSVDGNYKPISILSPINKILKVLLLHRRLTDFWKKTKALSNFQFNFHKQRSTNDAITFVHENILPYRDNNYSVSSLFLDFAKAFDSVYHQILLSKLKHHKIRGSSLELFKSYLTKKKQYTFLNGGYISSMLDIEILGFDINCQC